MREFLFWLTLCMAASEIFPWDKLNDRWIDEWMNGWIDDRIESGRVGCLIFFWNFLAGLGWVLKIFEIILLRLGSGRFLIFFFVPFAFSDFCFVGKLILVDISMASSKYQFSPPLSPSKARYFTALCWEIKESKNLSMKKIQYTGNKAIFWPQPDIRHRYCIIALMFIRNTSTLVGMIMF